jgi:hypothetical protein
MLENDHMAYLYRYECKGIQDWILAGNKLRDVCAASELIDGLPDDLNTGVPTNDCLSQAAGASTLRFHSKEALTAFAGSLQMRAARLAPDLLLIHAWVPLSNSLDAALADLQIALGAARQRLYARLPEAGPLSEIAVRTGQPAVARQNGGPDEGTLLDAAGAAKWREAQDHRNALQKRLRKISGKATLQFAATDAELRGDRIAVIHADGNGIGQWLMKQGSWTPENLKKFSDGLAQATELAFVDATQEVFEPNLVNSGVLPLRPVVVGGDDVTLLVRGEFALAWTQAFLQAFRKRTQTELDDLLPGGLETCAGIVWCKPKWPYYQAYALAESLCAAAKRELPKVDRGTYQAATSGLLFHRVTGSSETDWSTIRERELGQGRLSGGPWDLEQLKTLVALADVIGKRGIPRGTLRRWIDLVGTRESQAAKTLWIRFLLVGGSSKENKAFDEFMGALVATGVDDKTGMYADAAESHRTPLFDALTLTRMTSTSDSMTATEANG